MKIRKQKLVENRLDSVVEDIDTAEIEAMEEIPSIDDISSADIDEIATAVQTAAEEASSGEETFSDEKAKTIAKELKTYAQGFDAAAWAPLDVPSELTDKLDDCLANAMAAQAAGTRDGVDLLITGLPGSGKTGITKQWAEDRGVKLFYLNAKNDDLGAILNGFPVDSAETDADGNTTHKVVRSYSTALDPLKRPRSVLFLDEFNRAAPKLRASLLTLINEHEVEGPGEKGVYRFENLLFTVACINPSVPSDPGAMDLNDAEMSRFVDSIDWDSKADDAIRYIVFHINKLLKALDPADENYAFFYRRYHKILNLANALIGDYRFEFDSREDLQDLFNGNVVNGQVERAKMLNQRAITDALMAHGYSKEKFLNWVDKYSKFLDKDKTMIHDILDSYIEQDITIPGANEAGTTASNTAPKAPTTKTNTSSDSGDFDDVFGTAGDEADADLFGNTASAAGTAAKVSAADALNRIKSFDFSL